MPNIRPSLLILVAATYTGLVTAGPPEPIWDELITLVDVKGRVKADARVKGDTFRSAMGVRWQVVQPSETGQAQPVHLPDAFRTGDKYRLQVESLTDLTLYLLRRTPEGKWEHTNQPSKGVWSIEAGQAIELPSATDWFTFDDAGQDDGECRFRLLCTVAPLNAADSSELAPFVERFTAGKGLTPGQQRLKARYAAVEGRGDALSVDKGGLKALPPTKSPSDKDPVLVRSAGRGRWHTALLTDRRAEADWLLAHDIALGHTKGGPAVGGRFDPKAVFAVIIGVSEYEGKPLKYTGRDATQMAHLLANLGVPRENVLLMRDDDTDANMRPTIANIKTQMDTFYKKPFSRNCDLWFYFSGHGMHDPKDQTSYLLARDVPPSAITQGNLHLGDWKKFSLPVATVKSQLSSVPDARLRLMFIDACRTDGVDSRPATTAGLKSALGGKDLLVFSSCEASQASAEDSRFQHGVFTCQLLDGLRGLGVSSVTLPDQWVGSVSLHDKLIRGTEAQIDSLKRLYGKDKIPDQKPTLLYARELGAIYLCPATAFRNSIGMALLRLREGDGLFGSRADEPKRKADREFDQQKLRFSWPAEGGRGRRLVYLGQCEVTQEQYKAVMGRDENPSHFRRGGAGARVILNKAHDGDHLPTNPDLLPVESVSWYQATAFCDKLTESENQKYKEAGFRVCYRLPTEEEWEYACRAGTAGPFATGPDLVRELDLPVGNGQRWRGFVLTAVVNPTPLYGDSASKFWDVLNGEEQKRHPAPRTRPEQAGDGRFNFDECDYRQAANDWGFLDMHGNVGEWTASRWARPKAVGQLTAPRSPEGPASADDEMVVRGGSWYQPAEECRSASRGRSNPKPTAGGGGDAHRIGFRVLCEVIYP